ncbi:MAG: zinc ribbon domain-containing protein [bacterium]|nr:zinc ribbon domain-containing protein [bacterium]
MPTYEYECRKCGCRFERFQAMSAPPLRSCPRCRGAVRRLISGGAGIIFKGSGFYATDYRSSGYREAEKKEREAAAPAKGAKADAPKTAGGD